MAVFHHWIQHVIRAYGYLGVFASQMLGMFGLPVPDETILAFTGFLIFKGIMAPLPAFLAAYLGSICGITLNYLVGRYIGWTLLNKYGAYLHLTDERINQAHRWFERYGKFALFFGYFFPGVRHLTAFTAGASRHEFRIFAPYAYSGGFCWVATFLGLGYFLGEEGRKINPQIQSYLWMAAGAAVFMVLGFYLGRGLRNYARRR
ncbi:MAG: DedA family protein [Deltaproteobacteria bacterium]|nr:DedA family protein [Deltaproteobacteria bacterium]